MERIRRNLAERRLWEPSWLWRLFLASHVGVAALLVYPLLLGASTRYMIVGPFAGVWLAGVHGVRALYYLCWKRGAPV